MLNCHPANFSVFHWLALDGEMELEEGMNAYVYVSSAVVITPRVVLVCSCTRRNISDSGSEAKKASSLAASRAHSGRMLGSALPLASLGASSWVTAATAGALDGIAEVSGWWCCPCAVLSIRKDAVDVARKSVNRGPRRVIIHGRGCMWRGTSVGRWVSACRPCRGKRGTE